jgi:hypothetical protein
MLARKLLNMAGRTLSCGRYINYRSMTETVCRRYWNEKSVSGRLMTMLMHVRVCRLLALQISWSCRIRKFGRLQKTLVRRLELCSCRGYVVSCYWQEVCPLFWWTVDRPPRSIGGQRLWVRVVPFRGGGCEACMFCAGEDVPVSYEDWRLLFTERLESKLQVQFNLWASSGSCL